VARVVRSQRLPDGGYLLGTVGVRRIRVTRWLPDDPYPQADVIDVEEPAPPAADAAAMRGRAIAALDDLCAIYRERDPRVPELPAIADDAEQASYELAALAPIGPLDAQRILEGTAASDRLSLLAELLEDQARLLRDGGELLE
jgi:Lon protease-like protein